MLVNKGFNVYIEIEGKFIVCQNSLYVICHVCIATTRKMLSVEKKTINTNTVYNLENGSLNSRSSYSSVQGSLVCTTNCFDIL